MGHGWKDTWRYVAGIGACLALGWFPFVRGSRVPVFGLVDLGFHELGHLLTSVFPDLVTAIAGSATQILVPAGLAAYFYWARRDDLGTGVCLAWAGTAAADAAVYIADAPVQALPLIGGHHDWAYVLGRLGALDAAGTIASVVRVTGGLLVLAGIGACIAGLLREPDAAPYNAEAASEWRNWQTR